jgi:cytochrome c553
MLAGLQPGGAPVVAEDAKLAAYGRHLSRECTSCHRLDGVDNGIPSIVGWPADQFVAAMASYRDGTRTNPVMVSVATSLSDEQIDALAAFFTTLSKPERKAPSPATVKSRR